MLTHTQKNNNLLLDTTALLGGCEPAPSGLGVLRALHRANRALTSRDADKYVDGEADVVDLEKIINEFALLRNQWLGITKGLDQKQWQITNIVKLRVAGMEDANIK
ncbi:MAG: hypothetical protein GY822_26115 [Deltaproteobacteria bacterium]|nr:hypothetical protein [Deltaproteobacteria bacterium]